MPAPKRLRQEDHPKFEINSGYMAGSCLKRNKKANKTKEEEKEEEGEGERRS